MMVLKRSSTGQQVKAKRSSSPRSCVRPRTTKKFLGGACVGGTSSASRLSEVHAENLLRGPAEAREGPPRPQTASLPVQRHAQARGGICAVRDLAYLARLEIRRQVHDEDLEESDRVGAGRVSLHGESDAAAVLGQGRRVEPAEKGEGLPEGQASGERLAQTP